MLAPSDREADEEYALLYELRSLLFDNSHSQYKARPRLDFICTQGYPFRFCYGVGYESFNGYYDNSDVFDNLRYLQHRLN